MKIASIGSQMTLDSKDRNIESRFVSSQLSMNVVQQRQLSSPYPATTLKEDLHDCCCCLVVSDLTWKRSDCVEGASWANPKPI